MMEGRWTILFRITALLILVEGQQINFVGKYIIVERWYWVYDEIYTEHLHSNKYTEPYVLENYLQG